MRTLSLILSICLLSACFEEKNNEPQNEEDTSDTQALAPEDIDDDGDGQTENEGDCDDNDPEIFTDADETCNGIDNNCSGDETDAIDQSTWYADSDNDSYGDPNATVASCIQPSGYVDNSGDCNDGEALAWTGATDSCDGIDNNCSGDETDAIDQTTWYADSDNDTYGDPTVTVSSCIQPSGYVDNSGDCNDTEPAAWTGATDVCDGVDNNCSGDESDAIDQSTWYADTDGDNLGDPSVFIESCEQPNGYVLNSLDSDDTVVNFIYSGFTGTETTSVNLGNAGFWAAVCPWDGVTECTLDDDICSFTRELANVANGQSCPDCEFEFVIQTALTATTSSTTNFTTECDDLMADVSFTFGYHEDYLGYGPSILYDGQLWSYHGEVIQAQGLGNVSGTTSIVFDGVNFDYSVGYDDSGWVSTYFDEWSYNYLDLTVGSAALTTVDPTVDADGDGFSISDGDCNELDATIYPTAVETCDGIDNNCSGDESDAIDQSMWYEDLDNDTYGDPNSSASACNQPSGFVDNSDDCNDGDPAFSPLADELCDGLDNDCNGAVDDNAIDQSTWYADTDNDSLGDFTVSTTSCTQPSGYVSSPADCDDSDSSPCNYLYTGSRTYAEDNVNCLTWETYAWQQGTSCPDCEFEFEVINVLTNLNDTCLYNPGLYLTQHSFSYDLGYRSVATSYWYGMSQPPVLVLNGYEVLADGYTEQIGSCNSFVTNTCGTETNSVTLSGTNFSYSLEKDIDYYYYNSSYYYNYSSSINRTNVLEETATVDLSQ